MGREKVTGREFAETARKIHRDKHDYSKAEHRNNRTKICAVCPNHVGFWQMPYSHLQGHGCPKRVSNSLEKRTAKTLDAKGVAHEPQRKFGWLTSGRGGKMSLDFFLPAHNDGIERHGKQHYASEEYCHFTRDSLKEIRQGDELKRKLCEQHGIKIHYVRYDEDVEEKNRRTGGRTK